MHRPALTRPAVDIQKVSPQRRPSLRLPITKPLFFVEEPEEVSRLPAFCKLLPLPAQVGQPLADLGRVLDETFYGGDYQSGVLFALVGVEGQAEHAGRQALGDLQLPRGAGEARKTTLEVECG